MDKYNTEHESDYQILLLQRNSKLNAFGGYYAFPGGIIQMPDDSFENWSDNNTEFMKATGNNYLDFNKRISAIRETFEEVNMLCADNVEKQSGSQFRDHVYIDEYKSNFSQFCA